MIVSKSGVQRLESPQASERTLKSSGEQGDSDRLELLVRGRNISPLDEPIQSTPDIRADKVEKVRRELENTAHNVKAEKIAESSLEAICWTKFFRLD